MWKNSNKKSVMWIEKTVFNNSLQRKIIKYKQMCFWISQCYVLFEKPRGPAWPGVWSICLVYRMNWIVHSTVLVSRGEPCCPVFLLAYYFFIFLPPKTDEDLRLLQVTVILWFKCIPYTGLYKLLCSVLAGKLCCMYLKELKNHIIK